jgi:zinc transport system ATP-binding protein
MVEPVIKVENLNVAKNGKRVIEDATFMVERGNYMGVVGPNGGGKTTLLQAILGIIPHESGSIEVLGNPINKFSQWSKIAWVSQNSISFDEKFPISVRELVGLGRINKSNLARPLKSKDWEKVDETLEFMGIKDLDQRRIGHLSGGQKQRVFVAKALVRDPEILILDEPVTGVDAEAQERFYMKLSDLNTERGTTIMIVSHDLAAVFCRMSHIMSVNRKVYTSPIEPNSTSNDVLQKAYGEHFHFVFHEHICEGVFEDT